MKSSRPIYEFATTCVNCPDVRLLEEMEDQAREITYRTARRHLGEQLDAWAAAHGYVQHPRDGLTLKNDYHVRYYKSVYDGHPCIDVDWSSIDNIWTLEKPACTQPSAAVRRSSTTAILAAAS